ncbi:MAG: hypothetical protein RR225_05375 [Clostridium sp.]
MKKYILILIVLTSLSVSTAEAKEQPSGIAEPFRIEATAYCYGEITKDGSKVREGICAGREEWLGKTCIMYESDNGKTGDLIGIYEIKDTGGDYRLKNGKCVDIYIPSEDECLEFGRKDVFVQIIDAKG